VNSWGYAGFKSHTERVSAFYKAKRDVFISALERHLGGLAEWTAPEAGMFVWFKLLIEGDDSETVVRTQALEKGVLALPGTVFLPDGRKTAYVRASFSLLGEEEVEEACRRLGETVRAAKNL
jgi:tryptophan aminotransferase